MSFKKLLLLIFVATLSIKISARNNLLSLTNQFLKVNKSQKDSALYFLNAIEKLKNVDNQSKVLNCKAIFVGRWESDYQKALKIIDTALVTAKDSTDYYVALNSKGNFFKESGKYPEAIKIFMEYLAYAKRTGQKELIGKIYNNIGSTYAYANKDVEGIYYLKQALDCFKAPNNGFEYYRIAMTLGSSYVRIDSLQKGRYYLCEALKYYKNTNDFLFYADAMKEYSVVLHSEQRYDSAIYYMTESYKIFQHQNSLEALAMTSLNLSACYQDTKNIKLAEEYIGLGYKYALENKAPDVLMMATYSNYEFYKEQGKIEKALSFYELYVAYNDTFTNAQKQNELNSLNIKFKTAEKDNQLLKDKADITEKGFLIEKQKTRIYFISALFVLALLIVVIASYFIRRQRKLNKELTELNEFKSKVFTIISHDLRSPIASIVSNEKDAKSKASSALTILDNLLHWSYPQLNKSSLKPIKIILIEIIEQALSQTSYLMNSKQQKVVIDINDDFTFTGDHDTTLVIFRNLLSNAFKYSGESETITISQKNNEISISNICSKTTESGSGIGLIICKDLAVQNDYKLDFKINNDKAIVNLKV